MAPSPRYVERAVAGALADFDRTAGPGNVNESLIALSCNLLELAHGAPDLYTEADAERDATARARALGHAEQSIRDTWRSALRRTAGKARTIPEDTTTTAPHRHDAGGFADLAAYAASRGVAAEVFERAGWSDDTIWSARRRALRFETLAGPRWRLIDADEPTPKYWHERGAHTDDTKVWYRLGEALELATAGDLPIVLVNGEAAVVVAQHFGIPATCETGGGEIETPARLLAELLAAWPGAILIPADCDAKGRKAAPRKAAQYRAAGRAARAVDLGLGEKQDLADFCKLHQAGALAALLARPELAPPADEQPAPATLGAASPGHAPTGPRFYRGAEIDQIPAVRQLVKGYLAISTVALLIGPSEAGKSTIAVDLANKVAAHYPVIYVAGEDAPNVRTQIRAWEMTHQRHRAPGLILADGAVMLADGAAVNAFIDQAAPFAPRLVVIDTLSACTPGVDENSSDMATVMYHINHIADALGAAVLVLHHPLKSDSGTFRGHSSILNDSHTMWVAERDAGDEVVTLKVTRHKGTRANPATLRIVIRPTDIVDPDDGQLSAPVALPAGRVLLNEDHLSARQRAVLEYLLAVDADGGATVTEICREVGAQFRTTEGNVRKDVASLVKRALMTASDKQRDPRQITAKGRARIESDRADQVDQVHPLDPFVINTRLAEPAQPDPQPDPPAGGPSGAPERGASQTRSNLIQPDLSSSDQVPTPAENLIYPIRPLKGGRVDQVPTEGEIGSDDQLFPDEWDGEL